MICPLFHYMIEWGDSHGCGQRNITVVYGTCLSSFLCCVVRSMRYICGCRMLGVVQWAVWCLHCVGTYTTGQLVYIPQQWRHHTTHRTTPSTLHPQIYLIEHHTSKIILRGIRKCTAGTFGFIRTQCATCNPRYIANVVILPHILQRNITPSTNLWWLLNIPYQLVPACRLLYGQHNMETKTSKYHIQL
jgi:hypothetical protein